MSQHLNSQAIRVTAPGIVIDGKYRLQRQLGEGAMGVVWAATHEITGREFAIKLMTRRDPELAQRLVREAKTLGALHHRNIVDIVDGGYLAPDEPFLVMQLLKGETLADRLSEIRRLEAAEATSIAHDVAKALACAHAARIVHRDLKPANIFLHREAEDEAPVVKVLDFGVAKNLALSDGLHTTQGGAVGSLRYMSPEQARGEADVDHRADIWSLGIILFEMLTGQRFIQGSTTPELFQSILVDELPSVSRYVRRLDPKLVALVDGCLRRNRDERIQSVADLATWLRPFTGKTAKLASDSGVMVAVQPTATPLPGQSASTWPRPPAASYPAVATPIPDLRASSPSLPNDRPEHGWARGGTIRLSPEEQTQARDSAWEYLHAQTDTQNPHHEAFAASAPRPRHTSHPEAMFLDQTTSVTPSTMKRKTMKALVLGLGVGALLSGAALAIILMRGHAKEASSPEMAPPTEQTAVAPNAPGPDVPQVEEATPSAMPMQHKADEATSPGSSPSADTGGNALPLNGSTPGASPKPVQKHNSAASANPAETAAPVSTQAGTQPFNPGAALSAIGSAAGSARACKKPDGPTGSARVVITFAPSGNVTSARVADPPFAGTAVGECMASTFRSIHVPPFAGDPMTVSKTITLH